MSSLGNPFSREIHKSCIYFLQDEVFVRISDLQDLGSVLGADLYLHSHLLNFDPADNYATAWRKVRTNR